MQPALLDTSIYISMLRKREDAAATLTHLFPDTPLWLSCVVLEELYAGARERDQHVVEQMERHFHRANRIVVPNLGDWVETGKLLARFAEEYDYEQIGRGRLTNDALIASSAGRLGITVITANERDFRRLARFCSFQWQVAAL